MNKRKYSLGFCGLGLAVLLSTCLTACHAQPTSESATAGAKQQPKHHALAMSVLREDGARMDRWSLTGPNAKDRTDARSLRLLGLGNAVLMGRLRRVAHA